MKMSSDLQVREITVEGFWEEEGGVGLSECDGTGRAGLSPKGVCVCVFSDYVC